MKQLTEEKIAIFVALAKRTTAKELSKADGEEYMNPADFGNYDDVYRMGYMDARTDTAREILEFFGIKY